MDTTFHGASFFYLVPVALFLPFILWGLWSFGLKDVFRRTEAEKLARTLATESHEKIARRRFKKAGELAPRAVSEPPRSIASWIGRALAYAAFAAFLGVLSAWPPYPYWGGENGQLKLSLSIPGERKVPCVKRSREELAKLPANMRTAMTCSRQRYGVAVRVALDGQAVFDEIRAPVGLSSDGASSIYEKFALPVGSHPLEASISLDGGKTVTHHLTQTVTIIPGGILVLGFDGNSRRLFVR